MAYGGITVSNASVGLPPAIARRANKIIRPVDARDVYVNARAEFSRLVNLGAMRRMATGYYVIVPQNYLGDPRWQPDLEAVALGIGSADYGTESAVLMGVSAARYHGAIPRALATAVVAVPKQRPQMRSEAGVITFVKRDPVRLDTERLATELGEGWVTSIEQTLLDVAARPGLGGLPRSDIADAIRALGSRADWDLVRRLALDQHQPAALQASLEIAGRI